MICAGMQSSSYFPTDALALFFRAPMLWWHKLTPAAANECHLHRISAAQRRKRRISHGSGKEEAGEEDLNGFMSQRIRGLAPKDPEPGSKSRSMLQNQGKAKIDDVVSGLSDEHGEWLDLQTYSYRTCVNGRKGSYGLLSPDPPCVLTFSP